jgi:hypothetical protein
VTYSQLVRTTFGEDPCQTVTQSAGYIALKMASHFDNEDKADARKSAVELVGSVFGVNHPAYSQTVRL